MAETPSASFGAEKALLFRTCAGQAGEYYREQVRGLSWEQEHSPSLGQVEVTP